MHTKLTIPERLKDLRVSEKRMSLQELSDATGIPSSTLGNYEKDENIDMSLGNLITLANFYNVSTDYLLCRTELRKHKNQSISDLHINDDAIQILTDKKYNPRLLSELLSHENFKKFMTDPEIYIDGFNDKGIQIANAFLDVMRCKLTELSADPTDAFATVFDNSHIESERYYMNILSEDLKPIVSDLRNTHMKYSNTATVKKKLKAKVTERKELKSRKEQLIFQAECSTDKDMTNLSKKYDQMNNNLDILDSQDISLKKQLEKDLTAFREEKFHPDPEQYTELLDTRIQMRPDFRDKLIEQLKGTFGKYYDYHRRDIATNEVDYLNVEDPDVFSHRAWELKYQREQEIRRNQPARTKKKSYDIEL